MSDCPRTAAPARGAVASTAGPARVDEAPASNISGRRPRRPADAEPRPALRDRRGAGQRLLRRPEGRPEPEGRLLKIARGRALRRAPGCDLASRGPAL
jgi:hypothetical protein